MSGLIVKENRQESYPISLLAGTILSVTFDYFRETELKAIEWIDLRSSYNGKLVLLKSNSEILATFDTTIGATAENALVLPEVVGGVVTSSGLWLAGAELTKTWNTGDYQYYLLITQATTPPTGIMPNTTKSIFKGVVTVNHIDALVA